MLQDHLSLSEARRIALAAQGFDRPRPNGKVTASHLRNVIRRLGLVQIDFVNVLTPAHYLIPFSRLGAYKKSLFDEVVYKRREFTEQWAHEASILPVETWPLLRHRMEIHRVRPWGFEKFLKERGEYVERVLGEVRSRGSLCADDLPGPEGMSRRLEGAWIGTIPRAVLEALFGQGILAVTERRPNFARAYDLAERVIPAAHHGRKVEREDAQRELMRLSARAHGLGAATDLADYYRMPIREARQRIAELIEAGELREARVEGWREPAYLHARARAPRRVEASALLSPFDPVVWHRPRAARLFGFDYRIEIYTPQEKRRWGYYVLPFLHGERLAARIDLKADRVNRKLLALSAHLEPGADAAVVAGALAAELRALADWLGLETLAVEGRAGFSRKLAAAVRAGRLDGRGEK
jgi:uncharacterized protein YcaQ